MNNQRPCYGPLQVRVEFLEGGVYPKQDKSRRLFLRIATLHCWRYIHNESRPCHMAHAGMTNFQNESSQHPACLAASHPFGFKSREIPASREQKKGVSALQCTICTARGQERCKSLKSTAVDRRFVNLLLGQPDSRSHIRHLTSLAPPLTVSHQWFSHTTAHLPTPLHLDASSKPT